MFYDLKDKKPKNSGENWVAPNATIIGDVTLEKNTSIWFNAVLRGDIENIHIGEGSNIQDGSVVHVTHESAYSKGYECNIGSDVTVGHGCIIHACTIHDKSLIGMGSVILDGAIVETNVIVGAKSLVPSGKKLESGYLYMGSPCKQIRPLNDSEIEFLDYSASHYVINKDEYLVSS